MNSLNSPNPDSLQELFRRLDAGIAQHLDEALELRRTLHTFPELSWHEFETQRRLRDYLGRSSLSPRPIATTGLVLDVGPGQPQLLYRGDIDALPIQESAAPGRSPVSSHAGVSHACGHDLHATIAVTLARVFAGLDLPQAVRFVLQPAEEVTPSGGQAVVREGVMDGIRAAFALHADPMHEVGKVGGRVGALTSSTDSYVVRIQGAAGHSARPYLAHDAIFAASHVVQSLYSLVGQRVDPLVPAVVNVGQIQGGEARNIIAGQVRLEGTVRCLDPQVREGLLSDLVETVQRAAALAGCQAVVDIDRGAPSVVNDAELHELVRESAHDVLGEGGFVTLRNPSTGAEDFAFFGQVAPQYMMRLGITSPGAATHHLHTPEIQIDERALQIGCQIMGRSLLRFLAALAPKGVGV